MEKLELSYLACETAHEAESEYQKPPGPNRSFMNRRSHHPARDTCEPPGWLDPHHFSLVHPTGQQAECRQLFHPGCPGPCGGQPGRSVPGWCARSGAAAAGPAWRVRVGLAGQQSEPPRPAGLAVVLQQRHELWVVAGLATGQSDLDAGGGLVGQGVDLGGQFTARATQRVVSRLGRRILVVRSCPPAKCVRWGPTAPAGLLACSPAT